MEATKKEKQSYLVRDLYLLYTYRKVRLNGGAIRYLSDNFVGKVNKKGNYNEVFSDVELKTISEEQDPPEFNKAFVWQVERLSDYSDFSGKEITTAEELFNFLLKSNAYNNSLLDTE